LIASLSIEELTPIPQEQSGDVAPRGGSVDALLSSGEVIYLLALDGRGMR
jgi:hypothetical protein